MARNREKKGSLLHQVKIALDEKLAIGESKFEDKKIGATADKIYSWNTYKTYLKHNIYFIQWAKENHQIKSLDEGKKYVNEWLEMREKQGLSAYTVKLETSALMKLYSISSEDIYKSKARYRANINRSRGEKVRDKHFSEENHKDLVRFCRATGLRRAELQQLRGNDLVEINGELFIAVIRGSKGGRHRNIPLTFDKAFIEGLMRSKGEDKVFEKIPNGADIHSYRAEYATRLYKALARDVNSLPKSEKYHCRKDLKGICYDKKAMLEVSQALGHNRISVIAGHYIRK
jgi:integrase